jgi:anthranilate/para-aminobenzoate synthase component II
VILVIDNYDSFTFNLVQALEAAGARLMVVRNDRIDRAGIERLATEGALPSPNTTRHHHLAGAGSGHGRRVGRGRRVAAEHGLPLLGVCLRHQCLGRRSGRSSCAADAVHGEASDV